MGLPCSMLLALARESHYLGRVCGRGEPMVKRCAVTAEVGSGAGPAPNGDNRSGQRAEHTTAARGVTDLAVIEVKAAVVINAMGTSGKLVGDGNGAGREGANAIKLCLSFHSATRGVNTW